MINKDGHISQTKTLQGISQVTDVTTVRLCQMLHDQAILTALYRLQDHMRERLHLMGWLVVVLFQDFFDSPISILALVLWQLL
ncbi:hypothetical protein D3C81_1901200 [compost metagenome]